LLKTEYPLVSIIIPVYNSEKYLTECIESALGQTYTNTEIIIINDGSTDRSLDIINGFDNSKIVLINQDNRGASAAKQNGLDKASGAFIQYLDADDILANNKIEQQMISLYNQPDKIAVCKTAHFFDDWNYIKENIPDDDRFFEEYLNEPLNFLIKLYGGFDLVGGMIQPNAFLTPKNIVEKAGPWNTDISPCMDEDGEYFTRVILESKGIIYQPQILNYYRKSRNKNSLSGIKNEIRCSNLIESIWLKHLHLLARANSDHQITSIHNATYLFLDQVKVQNYLAFKNLVSKISYYQNMLSPSLKPVHDKLGGTMINFISKTAGWKFARILQHMRRS
jgi:glycosyltransferase involved in cell wall biosynthesis